MANFSVQVTIDESTAKKYIYNYNLLLKRYARSKGELGLDPDPLDFCRWLCLLKAHRKWRSITWRFYRSSVIYGLDQEVRRRGGFGAESVDQGINILYGNAGELVLTDSDREWGKSFQFAALSATSLPRISSNKEKALPDDVYDSIFSLFVGEWSDRMYSNALVIWMTAARLTGLRPVEWSTASLHVSGSTPHELHVRNAKATNGRANGEVRVLVLAGFREEHINVVRSQIDRCQAEVAKGTFTEFHKACSQALACATKHLYPRRKYRPTLYSARHQFIANAKASGHSANEVAALAGHASADTAKTHYARSNVGDEGAPSVLPIPSQVQTVREGKEWAPGVRPKPSGPVRKDGADGV